MRRRNFLSMLGGAAAWPLAARAQQPAILGFIHNASQSYFAPFVAPFRDGLKEGGYVEGRNVAIEYRWAEGHSDRLPALVADLLDHHVTAIFAGGSNDPAKAAKAATIKIPIVFVTAADPVNTGLVTSLNRPGGNVTGISLGAAYLNAKKLGLLLDLMPTASAIGALVDPTYSEATSQSEEFRAAASRLGVRPILLSASTESDVNTAFATPGAGTCRRACPEQRSVIRDTPRSAGRAGSATFYSDDIFSTGIRPRRRANELWA